MITLSKTAKRLTDAEEIYVYRDGKAIERDQENHIVRRREACSITLLHYHHAIKLKISIIIYINFKWEVTSSNTHTGAGPIPNTV